ncbi:putative membrane protein [Colletotrichum fructicola]|nr:putative membrane protein [Colletotrichum fructicola]
MDSTGESGGALSKLLPKSIAAKRRRRKQEAREEDAAAATAQLLLGVKGEDVTAPADTSSLSALSAAPPLKDDYYDDDVSQSSHRRDSGSYVHDHGHDTDSLARDGSTGIPDPDRDYRHSYDRDYEPSPSGASTNYARDDASMVSLETPEENPERSAGGDDTDTDRDIGRGVAYRGRAAASTSDLTTTTRSFDFTDAPPVPPLPIVQAPQPTPANKTNASSRVTTTSHSPERRRSRASTNNSVKIDTNVPSTPPQPEKGTPVIVNTPPTPTDRSAPSAHSSPGPGPQPAVDAAATASGNTNGGSAQGNMIAHRRGRSNSGSIGPSKLSNITNAPLTPIPDVNSASNPGTPAPGGGFFSSVFSAAQNAATQLSSAVQNTGIGPTPPKNKTTQRPPDIKIEDHPEVEPPLPSLTGSAMEKEPAVKTMGSGELSLSQLGITDTGSVAGTPVTSKFPDTTDSRSRSESAPTDAAYVAATRDLGPDDGRQPSTRPQSLHDPGSGGDRTPPSSSINEDRNSGIQRSGSIRSAIGRHRKRGSSAVSGANASVPKLTGFAVASKKRNRDFHALFKSVPDDDYLIEDYSCALQREILAHGRLYVSEGHLCFSSNILGWSTTLVMSFDEIVSVEKRSTALVFKNGLMISTLHAKHIFASFTSRDSTYDLIVNIWKLGHPTLKSSLNGVQLEGTGGDKTEKVDADVVAPEVEDASLSDASEEDSESGDDDDVYDEDDDNEDLQEVTQPTDMNPEPETEKTVSRKVSGAGGANGALSDVVKDAVGVPSTNDDFPGPATHAPTDCGDSGTHYEKVVGDDVIPAPIGKVYNLLFGPASVTWMSKWLTVEAKCTELTMEDKKGLTLENKSRFFSYIKPLNGAIGPRQTKCLVTETLESLDFEKSINLNVVTQTPDVPSGNIFSVKTKYCLSWAENNSTRVQTNCTIEWTGKSWLKGPIEKGANEGQTAYCKDLFASLKSAVSSKARAGGAAGGAAKGKKRGKKGKATGSSTDVEDEQVRPKNVPKKDWGPLEPVRSILEPILDIVKPLITGNMMYGLLVGLLVATWFGFGLPGRQPSSDMRMYGYPDRLAAYDEMWRREESELWEWLEERVGLERLHDPNISTRKRAMEPITVEERVREDRMDEREIEEAIKVTEEKLKVLKGVMDKKKTTVG